MAIIPFFVCIIIIYKIKTFSNMKEIIITVLDSTNMKACAKSLNLYLLSGDANCLKRAFFQALSQGWLTNTVFENEVSVLTLSSIDEVKDEVQSWFNPDVVKVSIG